MSQETLRERLGKVLVGPKYDSKKNILPQLREQLSAPKIAKKPEEEEEIPWEKFPPWARSELRGEDIDEPLLTPERWKKLSQQDRAFLLEGAGVGYEMVVAHLKWMDVEEIPATAVSGQKYQSGRVAVDFY